MSAFAKYVPVLAILGTVATLHADNAPAAPVVQSSTMSTQPVATKPKPLTAAEMNLQAAHFSSESAEVYQSVLALKAIATKKKDVIKVNCVNDKLIQLKAQMNIEETSTQELQASLQKNSDDRVTIFSTLTSTHASITGLRDDARACIGEGELYKQEAASTVTHPELPDNPVTDEPSQPVLGESDPPGYASPYN